MKRTPVFAPVAAMLAGAAWAAPLPPERLLDDAYSQLSTGRYAAARDTAAAYLRQNGPRFSAAFIVAASECMLHPHQAANAAPFRQLRVDYVVSPAKDRDIGAWIQRCASPVPRLPQTSGNTAGVSVAGLTAGPNLHAAEPSSDEPPARQVSKPAPPVPVSPAVLPAPAGDSCVQGYVWREASPGDHVCVTPTVRAQAADDNRQAAARRDPNGAYGPNSCVQGFVWRAARESDLVCVTPDRRAQAAEDNRQAPARRAR